MTRPASSIAVITDIKDVHVPFVQKHLDQEMIILDPHAIMNHAGLTFSFQANGNSSAYGTHQLNTIKSVWYRKPRDFTPQDMPVASKLQDYAATALQYHSVQLLTACPQARWVSDYFAMRRANNKTWQLEIASRLGFRVPDTVITSDPAAARAFIAAHDSCIVKPYLSHSVSAEKLFYTTKLDRKNLPNLDSLRLAPAIFQEQVDVRFDVRVTIVGDKTFAAIIRHSDDNETTIRDWRLGHHDGDLRIEPYEDFPAHIARLCVEHVKALGLAFGAIDLVMDKKNRLWFLENNPNGQWGFVERCTGLPIGKAMAELLSTA